jgi:hypothetical protein
VYPESLITTREVAVGGLTKSELVQRLRAHAIRTNASGERLFADPRFMTSTVQRILQTVELSVAELGFPRGARWERIYAAARRVGLELCPLELGPYLRLAYLDQPEGSVGFPVRKHRAPTGSLTVASKPLDDDPATPKGFYLRRIDGVLWLRGYRAEATHVWSPEDRLVFCRPPKAKTRSKPT